jgi:F0F1-type ATP synthase assembly protein I
MNFDKRVIRKINSEGNIVEFKHKKERLSKRSEQFTELRFSNVGFYLVTPLIMGVILGLLLDRLFNTKPNLTIFLIFIGAIASFYNLFKLVKDIDAKNKH